MAFGAAEADEEALAQVQVEVESAETRVGAQRKELKRLQMERAAAMQRVGDLETLVAGEAGGGGTGGLDAAMRTDASTLQRSEQVALDRIRELQGDVAKVEAALEESFTTGKAHMHVIPAYPSVYRS